MRDHIDTEDKMIILEMIYNKRTHPKGLRPVTLARQNECLFFRQYETNYYGWFAECVYADGRIERWMIIDLRYAYPYEDEIPYWFLQLVQCII